MMLGRRLRARVSALGAFSGVFRCAAVAGRSALEAGVRAVLITRSSACLTYPAARATPKSHIARK